MKRPYFLFSLIFALVTSALHAQLNGPNPTDAGSTQTYTWSGVSISSPVWTVSNGTKTGSSNTSVTVAWNTTATSGYIALVDGTTFRGSLNVGLKPIAPVASAATAGTTTSFTANWAASSTATSYQLDVSTSNTFSSFVSGYNSLSVSGTNQSVTGLTAGATYYYRVRGVNTNGASVNSSTITAYTGGQANVVTSPSTTGFTASWSAVTGASSYNLDISTDINFGSFLSGYNNLSLTATSKVVTGLTIGTTYYYRVRYVKSSTTSPNSNTITAPTITAAPSSLSSNNIMASSFTASWGSVTGATSYQLDVSTSSSFSSFVPGYNSLSVPGTSQSATGLSAFTQYYFRVRGINSSGASANSANGTATTQVAAPVLSASTSITSSSFTANWATASGAASYQIDVSTASDFSSFVSGYNNLSVAGTSQGMTGLAAATTYYIRARGVNGASVSINSTSGTILTLTTAPVASAATALQVTAFTANWASVSGAASYQLDVSSSSSFSTFVTGYNNLPVSGTAQSVTGLSSGTAYYYRVRGVNTSGASASGTTGNALTIPLAPTPSPTPQPFSLNVTWVAAIGADSYRVDVALDAAFSNVLSNYNNLTVASNSLSVTGLVPSTTYYVRTRSVNASGISPSSSTVNTTTLWQFAGLNENFIVSNTVLVDGITTDVGLDALPRESISQTVQYFDGLGRPIQTVVTQGSPLKNDIVSAVEYDAYGRESKKYLPHVSSETNGWLKSSPLSTNGTYAGSPQYNYYNTNLGNLNNKVIQDTRPLNETVFEPSPLGRPNNDIGTGAGWYTSSSVYKSVQHGYLVNLNGTTGAAEQIIAWKIDATTKLPVRGTVNDAEVSGGFYTTGQLIIKSTEDEQGNEAREYVDHEGHTILKKVAAVNNPTLNSYTDWMQTYYVYDDFGLLRFVLQPELVKTLAQNSTAPSAADIGNFAFSYRYDSRHRMIVKKVPGADSVYMVYDLRDRLVMTQDGNQRSTSPYQWTFTKYDVLNRPFATGIKDTVALLTQMQMQGVVDTYYSLITTTKPWRTYGETYIGNATGNVHGYTNKSYPVVTTSTTVDANKYLTVTYYDDYSFKTLWGGTTYDYLNDNLSANAINGTYAQPTTAFNRVLGHPTGSKTKVLDGGTNYTKAVIYYDDKYRAVQVISDTYLNGAMAGTDRTSTLYDFPGKVLKTKTSHNIVSNTPSKIITRRLEYDHGGRLLKTYHLIGTNAADEILLSKNNYNELGQLVDKQLHATTADSYATFKQSVDYRYNIRGWLTSINNSALANDGTTNDDTGDLFGMNLLYEQTDATLGSTGLFNGNISGMKWSANQGLSTEKERGYVFGYDALNRLLAASHKTKTASWAASTSYHEDGFVYDLNGNIKNLNRKGANASNMDQLSYAYSGNQLLTVGDAGDKTKGFIEPTSTTGNDYTYDVNGNMTVDQNKGITNIAYNHLNLPAQVTKNTNEYVKYIYDAGGRKLRQEVYNASNALQKSTDYAGEFIYENNALQFINHEEGRIIPTGNEYQYHLKDHLGNVRLTFTTVQPTDVNTATLETANATTEQSQFLRYSNAKLVNSVLFDHTNDASTGNAERLNGSTNEKFGVAKSLSVMPGDVLNIEVYAKYVDTNNANWTTALNNLISQIASNTAGVVADGASYGSSTTSFPFAGLQNTTGSTGGPKAYLNWLVFDRDYNLITASTGYARMSTAAREYGQDVAHEKLSSPSITITQPGYVYIYLSNEEPTPVDVFFDDLKVTLTKSPILQQDDYYPFGLTFNSYSRENSVENRYKFNQGTGEKMFLTERTSDLGLNVDQSRDRTYDFITGRWWQIDPLADLPEQVSQSTYQFSWNNPVRYNDPSGDCPCLLPALPWIVGGVEALYYAAVGTTVGYVAYETYNQTTKYKAQTLQNHNEGSFLSNSDPKNPNFNTAKKAAMIATAVGLIARLTERYAKYFGLDHRELENKLKNMSEAELQQFINNAKGIQTESITDQQFLGLINPDLAISATIYDFKKDVYGLERGQSDEVKKKENEEKEKGQKARALLNNASNLEAGTYTWDGKNWVLDK